MNRGCSENGKLVILVFLAGMVMAVTGVSAGNAGDLTGAWSTDWGLSS